MRRLLTWILVTLGIAAIARRLRRRGRQDEITTAPQGDDPADELRRKLAASRAEEPTPPEPAEPPVSPEESVEGRRADVHEQGRSTLDEMRSDES
jgi:hypothetical protein